MSIGKRFVSVLVTVAMLVMLVGLSVNADDENTTGTEDSQYVEGGADGIYGVVGGDGSVVIPENDPIPPEEEEVPQIVAMQVPKHTNFVMDPYHMAQKGSVWSSEYSFKNVGNTTVKLSITDCKVIVTEGVRVAAPEEAADAISAASEKVVRILICMSDGAVIDLGQSGAGYSVVLAPGTVISLSVGGEMSIQPTEGWRDKDVTISFAYAATVEQAEISPAEEQPAEVEAVQETTGDEVAPISDIALE